MTILTIRTDKPEAEVGLFSDDEQLDYTAWRAHRELSDTIHIEIKELLESHGKDWSDIEGVVVYKGPGSFTGLRIGVSVANALARSLSISIVGEEGEKWHEHGVRRLASKDNDIQVLPNYGSDPHITQPKK